MTEEILEQFHREMALLGVPRWSYAVTLERSGPLQMLTLEAQVACMKGGRASCAAIRLAIAAEQAEALHPGPKRYAIRRAAEQLVRHIEKETA